jgi:ABC-type polysaccharide/polyol phosphate export permease
VAAQGNPLYHCVRLVRDCAFGLHLGADLVHAGALALFALIAWRLAIWRMRERLIT